MIINKIIDSVNAAEYKKIMVKKLVLPSIAQQKCWPNRMDNIVIQEDGVKPHSKVAAATVSKAAFDYHKSSVSVLN